MADHPQMILDKLVRTRIFSSRYWKEECFGLNAEGLIDKAIKLEYIGSTYSGSRRPTKFICLTFKMLQMNLPKEIAIQFLRAKDYKYLTALGIFYIRLITKPPEVYQLLEPFYNDNRKLRIRDTAGMFSILYMDEFVDKLLNSEIVLDVILPRIPKRSTLEDQGILDERISILQEEIQQNQVQLQPSPVIPERGLLKVNPKQHRLQDQFQQSEEDSDDRDK